MSMLMPANVCMFWKEENHRLQCTREWRVLVEQTSRRASRLQCHTHEYKNTNIQTWLYVQKLIVSLVHYGLFSHHSPLSLFKLRYSVWERVCCSACECHFNPLTWTATEKLVLKGGLLLMWLFYVCFHIWLDLIFHSTSRLPAASTTPSTLYHSGMLGPAENLNTAWVYTIGLMPRLLIHLRIILKQIPFNRQGQETVKTFDSPVLLGSSWWGRWTL